MADFTRNTEPHRIHVIQIVTQAFSVNVHLDNVVYNRFQLKQKITHCDPYVLSTAARTGLWVSLERC